MTDKYEDSLKSMPHIRDHSGIVEWYSAYFYEIEEALKLARVAEDMLPLTIKAQEFLDLEQTDGNIWMPRAVQTYDYEWEWTQELLGTMDKSLAIFFIDTIKALAKFKENKDV